jgi:hypothetical protein
MALSVKQKARLARLTAQQLSCLGMFRHDFGRLLPGGAWPPNWHARMTDGVVQVTMTCKIGCGRRIWYWAPGGVIDWSDPHYTGGDADGSPYLASPDEHMERHMYRTELDRRNAGAIRQAAQAAAQREKLARRRDRMGAAVEDIERQLRPAGEVVAAARRHGVA